ncbi:two-component system chemotaxis response regulator CheV [Tamilnaduibacter salinus]|uniref:Chemotaxis protein CheW n=1 Tax=Tamilnaduibacter salinus TaxID=1484056 RepID=A0A2A2HZ26_9GAMM|nr:chemotaxis protein [Tamilnaduibacter salinus]PAV24881.1 chemotaxis protein CheW [Tamilnaduibacter salinus]PVY79061.1 two-component system chemotaxis response regulator CheV [Tamilnaduibacter salinus]
MSIHDQQIQKLLLFHLSSTRLFALGTLKIREILPFSPLNRLPHSHPSVIGTSTFRGSAVPVIDMAAAVGQPPLSPEERERGSIIIADVQRQEVGFLVRGVRKIIEADWKQVMPPPRGLGEHAFVTGLLDLDGEIVQLIDVELLLARVYPESLAPQVIELTYPQKEALRALNILLVDDSRVARKQICDALDQLDVRYQAATNGSEAMQMLVRDDELGHSVDILVSDIEMPGLDGYELTFNVRDNQPLKQPYIILHTSLNSQMSLEYANQVGADEALTKFDADELLAAILRGAGESA